MPKLWELLCKVKKVGTLVFDDKKVTDHYAARSIYVSLSSRGMEEQKMQATIFLGFPC